MIRITIEIDNDNYRLNTNGTGSQLEIKPVIKKSKQPVKKEIVQEEKQPVSKAKTASSKRCLKCGNEFKPTSNAQRYCSEKCGMKRKSKVEVIKSNLAKKSIPPEEREQLNKELDQTLAEIEARKHQPYSLTEHSIGDIDK